jgi:pimeloyl-ACP methyl ester carboxylesterase
MNTTSTPTAVLVHGAFADASGYAGIVRELTTRGYRVIAPANPLRGISNDAATVRAAAAAVDGPVVLVGHSYGGAVITQAVEGLTNVVGLVYLAAFAPAVG